LFSANSSFYTNRGTWGLDGATMGKTILQMFIHVLEKIFSRTSRPVSIKLDPNYPCMKGIQPCSNKGPDPYQRINNHKNAKIGWGQLKSFPQEPLG
jgi:hypothetical protein